MFLWHCFKYGPFNSKLHISKGSFTYYITQRRWVGGLQNVTLPIKLEKFYYAKVLLEVGGWSKYQKNRVT